MAQVFAWFSCRVRACSRYMKTPGRQPVVVSGCGSRFTCVGIIRVPLDILFSSFSSRCGCGLGFTGTLTVRTGFTGRNNIGGMQTLGTFNDIE